MTGVASGLNSAVARTGGLIATALLSAVLAAHGTMLVSAYQIACLFGAGAAVISALCAFLLVRAPGTHRAAVLAADVGWSDVGQWSTVWRLSPQDEQGNALRGRAVAINSSNVLVRSEDRMTAVIGLDNVIVVATGDAVLVAGQSQTHKVKELVKRLKAEHHPEATQHRRMYRPWGYYQSIDQGERYQVKRIVVRPGGRLSLQKHYHRAEHWIVVRGAAEVTLNGAVQLVHENESIYLPIGSDHRLANPGKIDLDLIEVQTGSYLGEDDIVRIEDAYSRT